MEFTNLEKTLQEYIEEVANLYKKKLHSDNKIATGDLINSVKAKFEILGDLYVCELELEDYYKYVENGSRPHWPPPEVIKKWIKDKPVIPREMHGITPTTDQLAFLISRKISRVGIRAGLQLTETIEELNAKWISIIEDALQKDIEEYIEEIILTIK